MIGKQQSLYKHYKSHFSFVWLARIFFNVMQTLNMSQQVEGYKFDSLKTYKMYFSSAPSAVKCQGLRLVNIFSTNGTARNAILCPENMVLVTCR